MGNQTYAPTYSAAHWPELATQDTGAANAPASLHMDPADLFNYLQQNRQRIGLSDQFQAYNEGDGYVMRMSRADAQHLMDVMTGFASTYMQMAQRNPQLLQAMNGQRLLTGQVGESACSCGGSCQCCGGCSGSWNRGNSNAYESTPQTVIQQPQDYQYQVNNGAYNYQPGYNGYNGYNGGYNGYNSGFNGYNGGFHGYNGYGWNRGYGGGNPLMQSLAYGGSPQQIMRNAGANIVSNLIFRGLGGGGFGRFRM
ncbi:MAG TPA: hypothetical protein V6C69_07035 [Trichormus sp.]|jgi:hypothetical protein